MLYFKLASATLLFTRALANPEPNPQKQQNGGNGNGNGNNNGLSLEQNLVQTGSESTGVGAIGSEAGQASSLTSNNNFINFCQGKTLTNGLQLTGGSCNGIVMGDIPAKSNMVSSIITNPKLGDEIQSNTDFDITVQVKNLNAGSFTNPDSTYYAAPQSLQNGNIVGHCHVTVQDLGNDLNPANPPDPTIFAFFKGINDAGNGKGLLTAPVPGGLPAGNYRVCTLVSSSNHQPVIMPVAQRGSQDDCTKFVVTGNGKTANAASNDGAKGKAAAALASEAAVAATDPAFASALSASAAATSQKSSSATSSAAKPPSNGNNGGGNNGGSGRKGKGGNRKGRQGRKLRFAKRQFVV